MAQIVIGIRLLELRKQRDYSQEELAKLLGITRTALTQIELGNRSVSAEELLSFSRILQFSLDDFFTKEFNAAEALPAQSKKEGHKIKERISVPKLQIEKFKQVLLYILEKCGGKPNVGETVLYKLLYFSEFNYYELYEEHLVGATFKKLPYGPVPQKLDLILNKMIEDRQLQLVKTTYFDLPQKRYLPLIKPDLTLMMASEKEVIDQVLNLYSDFSASAISDYSHKDMPWKATSDGDVIDYDLAFYREAPFSVRVYSEDEEEGG